MFVPEYSSKSHQLTFTLTGCGTFAIRTSPGQILCLSLEVTYGLRVDTRTVQGLIIGKLFKSLLGQGMGGNETETGGYKIVVVNC